MASRYKSAYLATEAHSARIFTFVPTGGSDQLMAGRQPRRLTLMWFQRNPLPVDWQAQRDIITNFE